MIQLLSKFVHIALILTVICSGYGNVLCYRRDGHIAVESVFHDHCQHDKHDHDPEKPEHERTHTHVSDQCSPCVDILISTDLEPVRIQLSLLYKMTDSCFAVVPMVWELSSNIHQTNHFTFFKPLKTIVLLT